MHWICGDSHEWQSCGASLASCVQVALLKLLCALLITLWFIVVLIAVQLRCPSAYDCLSSAADGNGDSGKKASPLQDKEGPLAAMFLLMTTISTIMTESPSGFPLFYRCPRPCASVLLSLPLTITHKGPLVTTQITPVELCLLLSLSSLTRFTLHSIAIILMDFSITILAGPSVSWSLYRERILFLSCPQTVFVTKWI